ncbi:MAG: hypothetical protein WAL72_28165 [Streptosporangiaceae bacterium]
MISNAAGGKKSVARRSKVLTILRIHRRQGNPAIDDLLGPITA